MSINTNKKGFTLVELSIVLVIIGLLIGGILAAQSMIGTAKTQSAIRQVGQFDAAVANFYTKFNALPGDNNIISTATTTSVDGKIADNAGAVANFSGDIGKFWYDLSVSGLKPTGAVTQYTDQSSAAGSITVGTSIPGSPYAGPVGVIAFGTAAGTNYYALSAFGTANAITVSTNSFKGADALAIDTKIDDGVATTGSVLGTISTTLTNAAGSTAAYNVTSGSGTTSLVIRLGQQTGNPQ